MNMLHFWGGVQKSTLEKCMQMGELDLPNCSYISVRGGCHPKPFLHQSKAYQNYNQNRWKQCWIFCASAPLAESLAATCPRVKMNASHKMQSHPVRFDVATFGPRNVRMESYELFVFWKCVSSINWKLLQPIGDHTILWWHLPLQSNLMLSRIGMCSSGHARMLVDSSSCFVALPEAVKCRMWVVL